MTDMPGLRRVVLRDTRDGQGTRHLGARCNEDGGITIEGQDLGSGVEALGSGFSEYEWVWTIAADQVPMAVAILGGNTADDPLRVLANWSAVNDGADPGSHLREAGSEFADGRLLGCPIKRISWSTILLPEVG
jgi:hypothetical protein